ncbi:Zinc finger protein 510 [Frankliniella fusca]|uniref:Zinc finger protein 510 n=1 Tax=Frankliniella fusca TaxID=407009 RepID=A0AAE1LDJ3_9NEOP|nr:Zinc finger protein 510 [Frankliniella fusca]
MFGLCPPIGFPTSYASLNGDIASDNRRWSRYDSGFCSAEVIGFGHSELSRRTLSRNVNPILQKPRGRHAKNPIPESDRPHACNTCGKRYVLKKSLWRHVHMECNVEPKFLCPLCGRKFRQKIHLMTHLSSQVFLINTLYHWKLLCSLWLLHLLSLFSEHVFGRMRSPESLVSVALSQGMEHIRSRFSTDKPFECHQCQKRYYLKKTLMRHLRLECNKEPQFQCHLCSKKFKQKSHLKTHILKVAHNDSNFQFRWEELDVPEPSKA